VKHVFVQSGIRMDVALRTPQYLRELVRHHVSGHLKVAPEHLDPAVLRRMRKPGGVFEPFLEAFRRESAAAGKEQYLVPYFISSFPGCTEEDMRQLQIYMRAHGLVTHQVQDFIPLPMTMAAAMYYARRSPDGKPICVARTPGEKQRQQAYLRPERRKGSGFGVYPEGSPRRVRGSVAAKRRSPGNRRPPRFRGRRTRQ